MATIPQAALAASVLIGLMAVPAASQTVDISDTVSSDLSSISGSDKVPESVSRTTSPDGFTASIETAFNRFRTSISPGSADTTLESPSSELEVSRTPGETEWTLTTSQGTLVVRESSDATVKQVSTPYGDLTVKDQGGAHEENFSGSNRERVEQTRHELEELLDEKRNRLEQKRQRLRRQSVPDVEVTVNGSLASSPEYAVLENSDFETVDINGWEVSDEATSHEFEDVEIGPRGKLYVYSAEESELEEVNRPAVFDTGISWNDNGDTASLFTGNGLKVDEESY